MSELAEVKVVDDGFRLPMDPIWAEAAKQAAMLFSYGDLIPHDWLFDALDIRPPKEPFTIEQHRKYAFELLRRVDGFRSVMLTEYQWYLSNVRGEGYRVVPPPQQTAVAMTVLNKELRRSLSKAVNALVHINESVLSLDASKENAEAKAKLAWLGTIGMNRLG